MQTFKSEKTIEENNKTLAFINLMKQHKKAFKIQWNKKGLIS